MKHGKIRLTKLFNESFFMKYDLLKWYINRLNRMSTAEIASRIENKAETFLQAKGLRKAECPSTPDVFALPADIQVETIFDNRQLYLDAADIILSGRMKIFAIDSVALGIPPRWNRDALTGVDAPVTFGKKLNYRDDGVVGNIKYLWEPNRHLQLVTLAQAYNLSGDSKYIEGLKQQLTSWFDQCPYMMGPNWTSSLELGIRLINWSICWRLIGGRDSPVFSGIEGQKFLGNWLTSIYQHVHFITGYYSRFSSANNHLIGEAAGVFVATVTWPCWNEFKTWQQEALGILEEESQKQNHDDGVNREQSISYQQFVLDFLLIAGLAGKNAGVEFSRGYWGQIRHMLGYLAAMVDCNGNVPMVGDADDGYVLMLSQEEDFCPYRSLLDTGSELFGWNEFKVQDRDDKTRWLQSIYRFSVMAGEPAAMGDPIRPVVDDSGSGHKRKFVSGGYYILGNHLGTTDEVRCVVDCGPLGYLSIAAHGHADALAVYVSVKGKEFLIDPGTYAYHSKQKWRDYFRGTSAHNTVRVDRVDQSVIGGNFMWLRHANAHCDEWQPGEDIDRFIGWHDGYARLDDPVVHRRSIDFDKCSNRIVIVDSLECHGRHEIERFWHFSEECNVDVCGSLLSVTNGGISMSMRVDQPGEICLIKGDDDNPLGWVSRRFDVKEPTHTAVCRDVIAGSAVLRTEICIS